MFTRHARRGVAVRFDCQWESNGSSNGEDMTGERETVRYTIDQPAPAAVPIPSTSRHHIVVTLRTSRIRDEQSGVLGHGVGPCSSQELGKISRWGATIGGRTAVSRRFCLEKKAKNARLLSAALRRVVFGCESGGSSTAGRSRLCTDRSDAAADRRVSFVRLVRLNCSGYM